MPPFRKRAPAPHHHEIARKPEAPPPRRPRADALRNRERVLEAAKVVFSTGGAGASLEAVAKQAGVGIGTLYRHFPTREALFEAVYRREVEQLVALAGQLAAEAKPLEALRRWMHANVGFIATKRGMSAALAVTMQSTSHLAAFSLDRFRAAVETLRARAVAAGEIRDDVSAEDMLRTVVGMCYAQERSDWRPAVTRLVDVFIDGLSRPGEG
jgi:AcrR family transcriptional regulator